MKQKLLSLLLVVLFMVSCGNDDKKTEEVAEENSSTEETYVPPIEDANTAEQQNQDNPNVATQDVQQMPAPKPAKDITNDDLKKLSKVLTGLQNLNIESQQRMMKIVQDNGLEVQKFLQIQQSLQNPNAQQTISKEERKKFDASMEQMGKIQVEMQQRMIAILKKENMTQQEYQSIMMTLQTNPELQQKIIQMQTPANKPKTK